MQSNDADIAAGEWLSRLDREEPSPEDLAAFERWKMADPRHAAAYARLAATWQALDRIQAIRPSAGEPIDDDYCNAALQHAPSESSDQSLSERVSNESSGDSSSGPLQIRAGDYAVAEDSDLAPRQKLSSSSLPVSSRPSSYRRLAYFSLAASLAVAFVGVWIAHSLGPKTYQTGIGGFQRVILDDQSAIELNTDTEVRVALTPELRKVELVRGEASFEVAHDTSRPFIVSAGNTAVRAVGTKFDVHRLENSVEVTVDEGRVAIGTPSLLEMKVDVLPTTIPQIAAGQSATASGEGVKLRSLPKADLARKLAWQNQMLVFDGDALADVVAQFNRYNARQLVIADPKLATLQIGGYFRPTNLDAFIRVLQSDFGIQVNTDGNRLLLATVAVN